MPIFVLYKAHVQKLITDSLSLAGIVVLYKS